MFSSKFNSLAKPLTNLLVKATPFKFNERCKEKLNTLKSKLVLTSIVISLVPSLPFEIMYDASDINVGSVLVQRKDK